MLLHGALAVWTVAYLMWNVKGFKMTNQEINQKLALAIGYREIVVQEDSGFMYVNRPLKHCETWWVNFDFMDWQVAGPIAERFDCFPQRSKVWGFWFTDDSEAHTPQLAIAMAVIERNK